MLVRIKGNFMVLSNSVFSENYFFIVGISELLTSELIEGNYYILDIDTTNLAQIGRFSDRTKKIVAFISNDLDYYALKHIKNILLIDKRCRLNEIMSCLFLNDSPNTYHVKYKLSLREREVLACIQKGYNTKEISEQLGMTVKTYYTYRRSLIFKLQVGNRISLYRNIFRVEKYKQNAENLI